VKNTLLPLVQKVDAKAAAFLEKATEPLSKGAPPQPKSFKKFCL
jgi:hypothetical protein